MTYNAPILMNVDTAFNVVLGSNVFQDVDHNTECEIIDDLTSDDRGCP